MSFKSTVRPAHRFAGKQERYWEEMFKMIDEYNSINLGNGMPDYKAEPQIILDAMSDLSLHGDHTVNQYTRGTVRKALSRKTGHPRFTQALAKLYSILMNKTIDPKDHIITTIGAYEALYCCVFGLVNPGEEVMIIEPHYDCYLPMVKEAGGVPVLIALKLEGNEWKLDFNELESKMNENTRLIIVNTPHNPLGKVFTQTELETIAKLCVKYNVIPVMDEVYEWITYEDNKHFKLASIDGMFERSISIGSVGKAFSVTGWKCGWAITGDPNIRNALFLAHATCCYTCPTNIQEATARALEIEINKLNANQIDDMYWTELKAILYKKRNNLMDGLKSIGVTCIAPQGSYFLVADCRELIKSLNLNGFSDKRGQSYGFVRWLSKQGVQALPLAVFYAEEYRHLGDGLLRFCYFKSDESLAKAQQLLSEIKHKIDKNIIKIN